MLVVAPGCCAHGAMVAAGVGGTLNWKDAPLQPSPTHLQSKRTGVSWFAAMSLCKEGFAAPLWVHTF